MKNFFARGKGMINTKSLREQIYDYLRDRINKGEIKGGDSINIDKLSRSLGISRTPLRDALLMLESDGFVEIRARKGVVVKKLTLKDIKDYYQIIGGLECAIVSEVGEKISDEDINFMESCNMEMRKALDADDFDGYYAWNLKFHDTYLNLSDNEKALKTINIARQRLYDFPRRKTYVPDWEYNSLKEHEEIIRLFRARRFKEAGLFIKDVHWSFEVQEKYILKYYSDAVDNT